MSGEWGVGSGSGSGDWGMRIKDWGLVGLWNLT